MNDLEKRVLDIIVESVKNDEDGFNRYIHKKVMSHVDHTVGFYGGNLQLQNDVASIPQVLVLVDKEPLMNWAHDCEYRIYHAETGELLETIAARMPPATFMVSRNDYEPIGDLVEHPEDAHTGNINITPSTAGADNDYFTGKKYALLFSGMSNNRHLNDLEFLYRVLIDVYFYDPANITVLNYDGTVNYSGDPQPVGNWPGNNTPYRIHVNGSGTRANLIHAFQDLASKLTSDDTLLIHTNNHGGGPTEVGSPDPSTLCCYPNWDLMTDHEFGHYVSQFPEFATLVVMMEQCHSGGFSNPIVSNSPAQQTSFSAAAIKTKNSKGGKNFDPYAAQWINGALVSSHTVQQIYEYAVEHGNPKDTPNEQDKPAGCSNVIRLSGA